MNRDSLRKDFTVILNSPQLKEGMDVLYEGEKAKIIKLSGNMGEDYCLIKLEKPDYHGCTIIEVKKTIFNYLTYPKK